MSAEETRWVLCPNCRGKTRTQIREDTVLRNFPLFCPKCKRTFVISICEGELKLQNTTDA